MSLRRVYLGFAFAFVLSYLFRMVNAVISPSLTAEFALSQSALGLLTGAFPVAFVAMQLPVGLMLDRHGPRNVEVVLLLVAAAGSLLFAIADSPAALLVARALIGAGMAGCLMCALNGFQRWYPVEKRPAMSAWVMFSGGFGAMLATTPVEALLSAAGWRPLFHVLAAATLAAAALVWAWVPASPRRGESEPLARQLAGVWSVYSSGRFWAIAPLMSVNVGLSVGLQGLWAVPWLMDVDGLTRAGAAGVLLAMSVVVMAGYVVLGMLTERLGRAGISYARLFVIGMIGSGAGFALIAFDAPIPPALAWSLFGGLGTVGAFGYNMIAQQVPVSLAGRATTALNLLAFTGIFAVQWGVGVLVDARIAAGDDKAAALGVAFRALVGPQLAAWAWFAWRWPRTAQRAVAGSPTSSSR